VRGQRNAEAAGRGNLVIVIIVIVIVWKVTWTT
jgi:hypothetical protein